MAQYFEVLSQGDNINEQPQFFAKTTENGGTQVHYVVTDDVSGFQPQQLSGQVMVLNTPQPQIVIDQNRTFPRQQFIQNTTLTQSPQIFYMETTPVQTDTQTVQTVIDQVPQPIVLNHQIRDNPNITHRPVLASARNVVQVRTPVKQPQFRPIARPIRPPQNSYRSQITRPLQTVQQTKNQLNMLSKQSNVQQQKQLQQLQAQQKLLLQQQQQQQQKQLQEKVKQEEELDDHDPAMNGSPAQLLNYKKLLEQRQQITKNPILARLPSNIKVTTPQMQKAQDKMSTVSQTIDQVVKQVQEEAKTTTTTVARPKKAAPVRKPVYAPRVPTTPAPRFASIQQPQPQIVQQPTPVPPLVPVPQPRPCAQQNYLILPPSVNRPRQQKPLPRFIASSQIRHIIENSPAQDDYSDSIRMLVLLESGEQRLITFTLPKEACTIQEILEQVQVPFGPHTPLHVEELNTEGITYVVTVGNVPNVFEDPQKTPQEDVPTPPPPPPPSPAVPPVESPKPPSPDLPRFVPGKLAVCPHCANISDNFSKCWRCNRKMPENVKAIDDDRNDMPKTEPAKVAVKGGANGGVGSPIKFDATNGGMGKPIAVAKRKVKKTVEQELLVISSDEEEVDDKKPMQFVRNELLNKLGSSISISPVTKEPSLNDIKKHVRKLLDPQKLIKFSLTCRTVRIGSYRFIPAEDITIDTKCIIIKATPIDSKDDVRTIRIDRGDIVKVLVCYNKQLPVLFYYLNAAAAPMIREMLNMTQESGLYFDPIEEKEDSYRKITLLPNDLLDEMKLLLSPIYSGIIEELTAKEANDILMKSCPKDATGSSPLSSFSEIKDILMYPKEGQGRLSINSEDYVCLAIDQFLNDKIIDFYLKYLWENMNATLKQKVHIFSTFFYKRLTMKGSKKSHSFENDQNLTAAEKRHSRVKNWTKRVNLFEKDFIVVPINENAHWFLAIICFPGFRCPQTFDGQPYQPKPKVPKVKKEKAPEPKLEKPIPCDDPNLSDKDEAESEDSDLESDGSEEPTPPTPPPPTITPPKVPRNPSRVPIKQPCILIFDSLAGPRRNRVVATLRDYLTVEYKNKMDVERVFNRDVIRGHSCNVPQQTNFTDCGLYLLQYVEQFFKDPIKDYNIPIKGIVDWFPEITVTKKREDICNLLKKLMAEDGSDPSVLPQIALPTQDGNIIDRPEPDMDHGEEEHDEDMFTDIEDSEMTDHVNESKSDGDDSSFSSPQKSEDAESPSLIQKFMTNKDNLKKVRINRHKVSGPELKKQKLSDE